MTILAILLILIALYCFGMWGWVSYQFHTFQRSAVSLDRFEAYRKDVADFTYRVGLCGTIALAALYLGG